MLILDDKMMKASALAEQCPAVDFAEEPMQLIIHAEQAGAEYQSHETSNFSQKACEICDEILLFLNVGGLFYGEGSLHVGVLRIMKFLGIHRVNMQIELVPLA